MTTAPGSIAYYNRACVFARMGEKDRAFEALNKAVEYGGYNAKKDYETDTDLQSLKSDSRWKLLIEKLK